MRIGKGTGCGMGITRRMDGWRGDTKCALVVEVSVAAAPLSNRGGHARSGDPVPVIPAQAVIAHAGQRLTWVPACAGKTGGAEPGC